jgi:hypothetical protein
MKQAFTPQVFDLQHYEIWRNTRLNKIEKIFGKEFFQNKTILELGCGQGHIGRKFKEWGAKVTFAEARKELVDSMKQLMPDEEVIQLNLEENWDLKRKFDIVIHWGVLYHLDNWKQDLECAINHGNLIFLETEVCDSDDPNLELKVVEHGGWDQAYNENKMGTRPSYTMVEKYLTKYNTKFTRYDDSDLNALHYHRYDWPITNQGHWEHGMRRFWIVEK